MVDGAVKMMKMVQVRSFTGEKEDGGTVVKTLQVNGRGSWCSRRLTR